MRAAVDRLAALAARGVQLEATEKGTLRVLCGALTPSERRGVTSGRDAVLEALRAGRAPSSVSAGEVHGLAVRDYLALPIASTVYAETLEGRRRFAVTVSRAAYQRCRAERVPVFVGGELEAIAREAALTQGRPERLRSWVERKRDEPGWRCAPPWRRVGEQVDGLGLTFGQLAWELDFRLLETRAERSEKE